ncbi:membrane protein FAM174-like [Clytia hemisphaerica]|uniref:Cnidarian restricted protein n=1 Tax=Clytia hemisphaerica TaxID=252671 RepID=A0A7M5X2B3_9CNID
MNTLHVLLIVGGILTLQNVSAAPVDQTTATTTTKSEITIPPKSTQTTNSSTIAGTTVAPNNGKRLKTDFKHISMRAMVVVGVICAVVILYFIIRAVCSRRRQNRNRKYGMLRENRDDRMEMRPLSEGDDDDDDDDLTLFDASQRKSKR